MPTDGLDNDMDVSKSDGPKAGLVILYSRKWATAVFSGVSRG